MKSLCLLLAALPFAAFAADAPKEAEHPPFQPLTAEEKTSDGSVTIGGKHIDYQAAIGTLVVHPKGWDDVPHDPAEKDKDENPTAEAAMSYVAYFAHGKPGANRPVTFIYNGGPGSATVWLHMGAFGPKRVVTPDDSHAPAAPYPLVNNDYSLLDASDLVFIDAPGTGFGRLAGKDKEKAFYGVDQDANAFAEFITQFLAKYGRWNSPKYLFGESYGTTRSAALADLLTSKRSVDLNGVILLSQILAYDSNDDNPQDNPGVDLPYELSLPTYAASAWYHHKLPADAPKDLPALIEEVEHFALTDYAAALLQGAALDPAERKKIVASLARYTGLPADYIEKTDLRINAGQFEKMLQEGDGTTTGRLDSRFSGPDLDPLSKEAEYDPQSAAISSAYVGAFNDYVRKELKFGEGKTYKLWSGARSWDFKHQPAEAHEPLDQAVNVMPDLAHALKYNPNLKIQLNAGYYDLATPFFEGIYEMRHLPIPAKLQGNIELKFYESGHMVYAHEPALKALHDNVAAFIRKTDNLPAE